MKKVSILLVLLTGLLISCNETQDSTLPKKAEVSKEPTNVDISTPQNTPPPPIDDSERLPELNLEELKIEDMGLYRNLSNLFPYDKNEISAQDSIDIMNVAKYPFLIDMSGKLPMRSFTPKTGESIQELRRNGEIVRVLHLQTTEGVSRRQRYYIKDNKVVYFVKREWIKNTNPPTANETFCLLEDGKMIKVLERSGNLEPGQKPSALAKKNVKLADHKAEALTGEIRTRWAEISNYLNGGK